MKCLQRYVEKDARTPAHTGRRKRSGARPRAQWLMSALFDAGIIVSNDVRTPISIPRYFRRPTNRQGPAGIHYVLVARYIRVIKINTSTAIRNSSVQRALPISCETMAWLASRAEQLWPFPFREHVVFGVWQELACKVGALCRAPEFVCEPNLSRSLDTCVVWHDMGRRRECTQIRRLVFSPVVFADPSFSRERGERGGRKYGTRDTYYSRFVVNHRMVSLNSALVSSNNGLVFAE
jgi:hypothetical protein